MITVEMNINDPKICKKVEDGCLQFMALLYYDHELDCLSYVFASHIGKEEAISILNKFANGSFTPAD